MSRFHSRDQQPTTDSSIHATVPLQIFKKAKCTWGVRSPQQLEPGTLVTTYSGELLTISRLKSGIVYGKTVSTTYLMDLEPY